MHVLTKSAIPAPHRLRSATVSPTLCGARLHRVARALAATVFACVFALVALPYAAHADTYELPRVHVQAQVMDNGDLFVTEGRTFSFEDDVNGVYWDIPHATNEQGAASSVTVLNVYACEGSLENEAEARRAARPFQEVETASSGDADVYTVESGGEVTMLKVYMPSSDGDEATVWVSYMIQGAVMAWPDTAELYWQFIGSEWEEDAQDVRLDLSFVLPAGATPAVTGSDDANFRAWGHGPLDGEVALGTDDPLDPTVTLTAPTVHAGQFAEVRATFPSDWVSGLAPAGGERLDTILSEEAAWAEEANAQRERARAIAFVGTAVLTAGPALLLIASFVLRRKFRSPKPVFEETYFRDVPSADHPAVLSALMHSGTVPDCAFIATLMKLTDDRVVELRHETRTEDRFLGLGEKRIDSYSLKLVGLERVTDPIDRCAIDLYFGADAENGEEVEFDRLGEDPMDGSTAGSLMEEFKSEVLARLEERGLTDRIPAFKYVISVIGIVLFIAAVIFLIFTDGVNFPLIAGGAVLSIAAAVVASSARQYSQEAVELLARCRALEKWLVDFTNLDEAVPGDLILWNKLLVLAVAFGVSEEVVRQLADAVPEDLRVDESGGYYYPSYWWFYAHGRLGSPMSEMHDAYQATVSELASSSSSSSGGFGGGFSGGGGGGVGGGGGGTF